MKIVFANPPVLRSDVSSPENDFYIGRHVYKGWYRKVPGLLRILRLLGIGRGVRYGVRAGSRWPWTMSQPHGGPPYPFFMGYAAALLKRNGYNVNILDAVGEESFSYEKFLSGLSAEKPDIVVLECSTPTIDIDVWISKKIAHFAKVALAGPHLMTYADELAKANPHITYFLKGEYILNCLEMVRTLRPGIYEPQVVEDLDSIPPPYRDYPTALKYYEPTMPTARPQLQVYGSKGCPFKCVFCMWPQTMYFGKVSLRKPEMIAAEIKEAVSKYGFKSIMFDDDTFNVGNERVSLLCDELKTIGLPWTMMGRLDCSPDWLFDKMVESGCVGMRFGVETFDPIVLKNIKKGLVSEEIVETLQHITRKHPHLMIHLTMMRDMPGQTEESHQKDIGILKKLGYSPEDPVRNYQLSSCAPFPGTELYRNMMKAGEGERLKDFERYDGGRNTVMSDIKKDTK